MKNRTLNRLLGQFFTPKILVDKCISLIERDFHSRLLEPSCGYLAFKDCMRDNSVFIEIDKSVINDDRVINMDFFQYPITEKFDTIIGNPPYVDNKFFKITHKTDIKCEANLYLYFIEKCFHHLNDLGELIFIVPRDFIKATSARVVNKLLLDNGTITHFFDYGDTPLFKGACPNVCIFRYEKGNFTYKTETFEGTKNLLIKDGIISFSSNLDLIRLGDMFDIKVGAVSGGDNLFEDDITGVDFVYSQTAKTGKTKKMIYNTLTPSLQKNKDILINRKIRKFNESNWWEWGRKINFKEGEPRIYVNSKTRNSNPFFINKCDRWDGSVLALFPKYDLDIVEITEKLNSLDWKSMGFVSGGRYIFSQKSLSEALIEKNSF